MKKLIAILVVFALVAGAAFAETSIGGAIETRWVIAQDNGASGSETTTQATIHSAMMSMSGANDEGTWGGTLQMTWEYDGGSTEAAPWAERLFVWWQPIPQFKFQLGQDGNGLFNTANLSRWGHHRMPRGIAQEDWDAHDYLIGNYDAFGAVFMLYPIDGLAINLVLGLGGRDDNNGVGPVTFEKLFEERLMFQVAYSLADVGTFYFTYIQKNAFGAGWPFYSERFGFTFFSGDLVDGLAFEIGGNYDLDATINELKFGLGVHYTADGWGVRARAKIRPIEVPAGDDWINVTADIMPFVNLDFGTLFCNIRLQTLNKDDLHWHINPYLQIGVGSGDFRIGAMIGSGTTVATKDDIGFKLALSMLFAF